MSFLKQKAIFMCFVVVFSIFSVYNANVYAQESTVCCEQTKSGERCVNTDINNCDSSFGVNSNSCSETSFCRPVCCSTEEGCFPSTSFSRCVAIGGESFQDDVSCNSVNVCQQGCCKLGNQCSLTTEAQCEQLSQPYPGLRNQDNFLENVDDENACLDLCEAEEVGCCVTDDLCDYTTRELCTGTFNEGDLCSDIGTCGCNSHSYKSCKDGDVYWFDSCDNIEEKAEDCDIAQETTCGDVDGEITCKSINCENTYSDARNIHDSRLGGFRKHGESWCVYEGPTGNYTDYVGSRQYQVSCLYGEEKVNPCRDFREEVYIQKNSVINGQPFSEATCIDNNIYSSVVNVNVSTVPTGQRFWEEGAEQQCSEGNSECTVVWVKKSRLSSWKCKQNCECENADWLNKANLFCKAQGDCGADYNVNNVWSDKGLSVKWEGSARGPRPRKMKTEGREQWNILGLHGGMEKLYEKLEEFILDAAGSGLSGNDARISLVGLSGAVVVAGIGIATALSSNVAVFFAYPIVGIAVFVIFAAIGFLFGGGKSRTKTITVECGPWQAPRGGDQCETCNGNFLDCDEYKCRSLGASCEFVNAGSSEEACVDAHPNDVSSPKIEPWNEILTEGYDVVRSANGYKINREIEAYETLTFGIKTDEIAECRISEERTDNFDEMNDYFETFLLKNEHKRSLFVEGGKEYNFYVRCQDVAGNSNAGEYLINFKVKDEPDLTPPRITRTSVDNGAGVQFGVNNMSLLMYTNEPAECRYAKEDMPFSTMLINNSGICNDEPIEDILNFDENRCLFGLSDIKDNQDNVWYFRCKDLTGNVMQQSYKYVLKGTTPLEIESKSPEGEVFTNSPKLEIKTKGGVENGKAVCDFKLGDFAEVEFLNTNSNVHSQQFDKMALGFYNFNIKCRDAAGNEAVDFVSFSVAIDSSGPGIKFIYKDTSNLHLIMGEDSTCEYSEIPFVFGQGEKMTGEGIKEHKLPLGKEKYHVVCEDKNGNVGEQFIVYP